MKSHCDNCNFGGEVKQVGDKMKILCLYTDIWHKVNYSCGYWKLYDPTLTKYERLKLAKNSDNKIKAYQQYLANNINAGLVSLLGSIAIVLLIIVGAIGAFALKVISQK